MDVLDTDGNGTLELVLKQEIPIWSEYSGGLPWRKETRICTWNGEAFVLINTKLAPPEYRFQAVQDGDMAALQRNFEKALSYYQQAIFDDKLDWWTQERRIYEIGVYGPEEIVKPTPLPSLLPDPTEYSNLAAYAYYRIMLLHSLQNSIPEAQIAYDTLQEEFPPGKVGHAYAKMAFSFWQEFQQSENLGQACDKAIEYAAAHPVEILAYLGNSDYSDTYYGEQSLEYSPIDICPFH